jgi:CubicO group peptidase (beta-lactamase class C family)
MNRREYLSLVGSIAMTPIASALAEETPSGYQAVLAAYPEFNGTIVVGRGSHILFSKAIGVADPQSQAPMALGTRFETGSVSKWVASMVVMKMVDQGILRLDEPIKQYLPDYRADNSARLTLRHLMSHSSGVPNELIAARKADPAVARTELRQMEAVQRYASGDLQFVPGTTWDYSHSNWLIVKAIVEHMGGRPYRELLAAWLTEPLGLRDSGLFIGASSAVPGMALGYAGPVSAWQRKVNAVPEYMAMAGGFYSSAPDMLRLMDGVLTGGILTPASRAALMNVNMPDQRYALGGRTRVEQIAGQAREAAWEDGSNGGFRLVARRVLADGVTVIVFNNSSFDHQKLGTLATSLMEVAYSS